MIGLYFIGTVHGEKFNGIVEFCSKLDAPASAPGDKSLLGLQMCASMLGRIFFTDSRWGDEVYMANSSPYF